MKKIIAILLLFISAKCFSQNENNFMQKNTFWDSVYFKAIQYSASAGIVHLGIDTVAGSPTFGKLVRQTAGGSTPTLTSTRIAFGDGSNLMTSSANLTWNGSGLTSNGFIQATGTSAGNTFQANEIATPSTPSSGTGFYYFKSDNLPYAKNDAGTEMLLFGGGSTPTLQQVLTAGSTLTTNNTISTGTNITTFSTGNTNGSLSAVNIDNTGAGGSFGVTGNSGTTVVSFTNSNIGDALLLTTGSGAGVRTTSTGGLGASFVVNPTSTNTSVSLLEAQRLSSGTAANRMAGSIDLKLESASGTSRNSNKIVSMWADATDATRSTIFGVLGTSQAVTDTLMAMGDYVTLTESSATKFNSTTIATGKIQGGSILITIEANDATDFQSRTLRFIWSAVNKAGTLTITLSTPEEVVALSSGTLTCTITAVDAGSGVLDFKANAVSSLTQSTLRATYQTFKNF